jgi:predicted transcriptional regulator
MGNRKNADSFENQLAIALKLAAVHAAANLIRSNPELTLEDFYSVMRPQGVTETITIGELMQALSGNAVRMALPRSAPSAASTPTPSGAPKKPRKRPNVDCRTIAGQNAYHSSILTYLRDVDDWVRGPDIQDHCGGTKSQFRSALRNLARDGYVEKEGETYGSRYRLSRKNRRKKTTIEASENDDVNARTHAGRDAYHKSILRYLKKSRGAWRSGNDISEHCGGNKSQRNRALNNMLSDGLVENNGERRQAKRWRALR